MNRETWSTLLSQWCLAAVERGGEPARPGFLSGLGFTGASESQLAAAELRLGRHLPPSYRGFLECTNGLLQPPGGWAARGGDFWSAEEIDWFRVRNEDWIAAYDQLVPPIPDDKYFVYGATQDAVAFRAEYLRECLEITHDGDSSVYLLNPMVIGGDGEWEAWHFANWYPGAARYRSFADMMREHYDEFMSDIAGGF